MEEVLLCSEASLLRKGARLSIHRQESKLRVLDSRVREARKRRFPNSGSNMQVLWDRKLDSQRLEL